MNTRRRTGRTPWYRGARRAGALLVLMGATVLLGASAPHVALARQSGTEQITRYDIAITINRDDSINVTETIDYDFGANRRHGIERIIPVRFPYQKRDESGAIVTDNSGRKFQRQTPISDLQVTSPTGAPTDVNDVSSENSNSYDTFRIGDPNTTIAGRQTYVLRYRMGSVLNGFTDHDELNFNVVGGQWPVPIRAVTAKVSAPGAPDRVLCFAGPEGSTRPCDEAAIADGTAQFSQQSLRPRESMTVVISLPKGLVNEPAPDLVELWTIRHAFSPSPWAIGGGVILMTGGLSLVGLLLWRNGRDRRFAGSVTDRAFGNGGAGEEPVPLREREANPVEFVPPEGVRPGHMGTLWDEQANPVDVSAMIIDLAVRGFLRIDETAPPTKSMLGQGTGEYRFVRLKAADATLLHAELELFNSIFQDGEEVDLSSLRQHFATRLERVKDALYDDTVTLGWFSVRPDRVRNRWHGIGLMVTVIGSAIAGLAIWKTSLGFLVIPLPILGLTLLALGGKFPRRTAQGTAMLGRVRGFKELFAVGEGERQRFAEQKGLFSQYLPYAIVFGCAEQWAATFASLGATSEEMGLGTWYTSPYRIDPFTFGWALTSFGTATAGSIAMAAPSSVGNASGGGSGFSGGGFSGGGFGGGGGGSW